MAAPLAAFAFALVIFVIAAPWDPDPHHDGFQFAVAVGIADGRALYAGVFDQYGPVTAWVQGLAVWLFGPKLVVLRYEIAVVLAVTAGLITWLVQRHTQSRATALIVALAWVAACPVWASYPGQFPLWPWPSAVLALFMLGSVVAFEIGRSGRLVGIACSGSLVAAALLTRWPSGLLLVAVFVVCILWFRSANGRLRTALAWWGGFAAALVLGVSAVGAQGAMSDFVFQTIIHPFTFYSEASGLSWFEVYYGAGSLSILVIAASVAGAFWCSRPLVRLPLTAVAASVAVLVIYVGRAVPPATSAAYLGVPDRFVAAADVLGESTVIATAVATPLVAAVIFLRRRGYGASLEMIAPLGGVAITTLAQLYPLADVYHLWWAAPASLVFVTVFFHDVLRRRVARPWLVIATIAMPFVFLGASGFRGAYLTPRSLVDGGVLAGMLVPDHRFGSVDVLRRSLLSEPAVGAGQFMCRDGLVSVFSGRYAADTAAFVDWAWIRPEAAVPSPSRYTVLCSYDLDSGRATARAWSRDVVYETSEPVRLSPWSEFYVFVLEAKGSQAAG